MLVGEAEAVGAVRGGKPGHGEGVVEEITTKLEGRGGARAVCVWIWKYDDGF